MLSPCKTAKMLERALHEAWRSLKLISGGRWLSTGAKALHQYELPWSVVKPFDSIRVNLTDALSAGWNGAEEFPVQLQRHIQDWRIKGHSAVWLHIPIPLSRLISTASEQGFTLHHGNQDEVVLSKWLQDHKTNRLPRYASHQVGVCGVVLKEDTYEVLVTQDKYKPPVWKFPGGVSEFGEDISDAAVREVREETGILSDFVSVLAFRQQHSLRHYFNISDLYFVCRMRPNTHDIHPCQDEILKCRWMSVEELATTGETTPLSHRTAQMLLEARQKGFHTFDIGMQEVPMNFPDYTTSRKYKLFMKSDGS